MAGNHFVASIDIGTEKIALLVAEREDDDHLRIIGHNVCPSKGVRRGSIFSIDSLSREISKLIKKTEESFGISLALFRVNISDTHLTCIDGKGKVPVNEFVSSEDLDAVLFSEPVKNNTDGTTVSPNPCEPTLPTTIGLVYAPCPNGAAVIGNEPSSTHST